jgi:hypothetical protein
MESNRLRQDTAADGMSALIAEMTTEADKGSLQQLLKAAHTECHEQCRAAGSKTVCLQQVENALTAEKIQNFALAEIPPRRVIASKAS